MTKIKKIKNIKPLLKGLNLWTLLQKIKDYTVQRKSTFQLRYKIDTYKLTPEDKVKFNELKTDSEQISFLKLYGKLHRTTNEMPSHSFVYQFMQVLYCIFGSKYRISGTPINILDTGSVSRNSILSTLMYSGSTYTISFESLVGDNTYGIIAGTGTNAPTNADVAMQTPIAHGTGAGQLVYQKTNVGSALIVGANVDMNIIRIVTNNSGDAITLKEIGIVTKSTANFNFLMCRDAVDQAIADDEIALIQYIFRTTV